MRSYLLLVSLILCAASSASAAKGGVFLNGVNIDGVTNQKFENVTVVIDDKGNVLIQAKGYEVQTAPTKPVAPALPAADAGPVTKRYFLVAEIGGPPGMAQYEIDVFVNSVWIKRISSADPQAQSFTEISRHLKKGKNTIHFTATKQASAERKSSSPNHFVKVYVGEGNMGGNTVMIENVFIPYKRDASETQNFADEFVIEGK